MCGSQSLPDCSLFCPRVVSPAPLVSHRPSPLRSAPVDRTMSEGNEPPRGGPKEPELLVLPCDRAMSEGNEPPGGGPKEPELLEPPGTEGDRARDREGSEQKDAPRPGPKELGLRLLLPERERERERPERKELPRPGPKELELLVPAACLARVLKQVEEEDVPLKGMPGLPGFSGGSGLLTLEEALNLGDADLAHLLGLADDEEKCRQIRKQYRQLIHNVQQNREDIVNTASDSLTEALEEANALFDTVSRTREAALDAQFLVLASDLGKEKAKQLNSDMSFFNQVAFCDFLLLFVGLNWLEADREALTDCDDNMARSFWETVHKEATCWILQADTFHFMFSSFKTDSSAPKRRVEYKRKAPKMEESGDMPTKLRRMDLTCNQEATEKEVERILGLLQTYFRKYPDTPVSYFEFVIDPTSFSRTVENIFYVSFIIRDGFARIRLDQDRLPILEPIDIDQMGEGSDFSFHSRKQGIISLSLQDWKNIVATFEISEAMIKKY
ncbi:EP300-interacting inhibitor of differentiation 3 [Erinaceus europaeus]|uniref:Non-structural maintenance of chromosomes element 4 n=1 Tax=Erinaceus europaeus TaxID=9365 RepID=A0A1S3ADA0_ERIEU|nr:EP300-interacting inhibitor of differentiation 3 [Erinaceus europaeus]